MGPLVPTFPFTLASVVSLLQGILRASNSGLSFGNSVKFVVATKKKEKESGCIFWWINEACAPQVEINLEVIIFTDFLNSWDFSIMKMVPFHSCKIKTTWKFPVLRKLNILTVEINVSSFYTQCFFARVMLLFQRYLTLVQTNLNSLAGKYDTGANTFWVKNEETLKCDRSHTHWWTLASPWFCLIIWVTKTECKM